MKCCVWRSHDLIYKNLSSCCFVCISLILLVCGIFSRVCISRETESINTIKAEVKILLHFLFLHSRSIRLHLYWKYFTKFRPHCALLGTIIVCIVSLNSFSHTVMNECTQPQKYTINTWTMTVAKRCWNNTPVYSFIFV